MLDTREGFWNVYIGQRCDFVTESQKFESEIKITIDFTSCKKNRGKKSMAIF